MRKFIFILGLIFIILSLTTFAAAYIYGKENGFGGNQMENKVEFIRNFDENDVNNIVVNSNHYNIKIEKGAYLGVYCEAAYDGEIQADLSDGTLTVKSNSSKRDLKLGFITIPNIFTGGSLTESPTLYIYLPENIIFDRLEITSNFGNITAQSLLAQSMSIKDNVGNLTVKSLAADSLETGGGVGNLTLENSLVTGSLSLSGGVGNISFSGEITGPCKIDAGVGNLKIILSNPESFFNYKIKHGLGNLTFNGKKISELSSSDPAKPDFHLSGGVGNISITTNQ